MTLDEIQALIDAMGSSDLSEMEVTRGGWTLRLSRHPSSAGLPEPSRSAPVAACPDPHPLPVVAKPSVAAGEVRAPLAGIVYLSPSPGAAPFVGVGERVEAGAILCTIEAMKTFNEVRAERAGTVAAVLVGGTDEIEAGQALFRIG